MRFGRQLSDEEEAEVGYDRPSELMRTELAVRRPVHSEPPRLSMPKLAPESTYVCP